MAAQIQFFEGPRARVLKLASQPVVVGGRASEVRVPGATVTRRYARFVPDAGRYLLETLAGDEVRVNGQPVQRVALKNRDRIEIGSLEIEYFEW